jgi:coenzyme F420-reducing hydrogenase delta subunit
MALAKDPVPEEAVVETTMGLAAFSCDAEPQLIASKIERIKVGEKKVRFKWTSASSWDRYNSDCIVESK